MELQKSLDTFYYSTALCALRLMNKQVIDENITYNSLLYIELIHAMNGSCTASKLAELLHISKPGVTSKLNELLRQNLITKTQAPGDRRKNYLAVNEEAIQHYKDFRHQDSEAIKRINKRFTPEEIGNFCEMLNIISDINF